MQVITIAMVAGILIDDPFAAWKVTLACPMNSSLGSFLLHPPLNYSHDATTDQRCASFLKRLSHTIPEDPRQ